MNYAVVCATILALGACFKVAEDKVFVRPLAPAERTGLDCDKVCSGYGFNFDSVNFCTVATASVRRYLACSVQVDRGPDTGEPEGWELGIDFPTGLDPATRGAVDLTWCPETACAAALRGRVGDLFKRVTVTGCRVPERPRELASDRFLVCSIRTKTDPMVAFQ